MAEVLLDMAVSLDGLIAGPGGSDAGLYDWYFNPTEVSSPVIGELVEATGAIVMGRGAFATGEEAGGWDDTPYGVPHFVITHHPPAPLPSRKVEFVFVTDGVAAAVDAAKKAAGGRYVTAAEATSPDNAWWLDWSMSCNCTSFHSSSEKASACSAASISLGV
jgi:dihydrofolate reductase